MADNQCDVLLLTRDAELRRAIERLRPPSARLRCLEDWPDDGPPPMAQLWIDLDALREPPAAEAGRRVYFYNRAPRDPERYPPGTFLRKPCPPAAIAILWAGVERPSPAQVPPLQPRTRPEHVPTWLLDLPELRIPRLIERIVGEVCDRLGYARAALYLLEAGTQTLRLAEARQTGGLPQVLRPAAPHSHPLAQAAGEGRPTHVTLSAPQQVARPSRGRVALHRWRGGPEPQCEPLELLVLPLPPPAGEQAGLAPEGLLCLAGPTRSGQREVGLPLEELARTLGRCLNHARRYAAAVAEARLDALTGLYNCRWLYEQLERETSRVKRSGETLAIAMLDLDDLKRVNDRWGHLAGDAVLRHVAECIRGVLRHADSAARLGGDEFVVILPDTDAAGAARVARRLEQAIAESPTLIEGTPVGMTASIGTATWQPGWTLEQFIDRADRAMYARKKQLRSETATRDATDPAGTPPIRQEA